MISRLDLRRLQVSSLDQRFLEGAEVITVATSARARARAYDGVHRSRLGGLARIIGFVLLAIVVVILGVLLLFKALDWATQTPGAPGGHEHIL